MSEHSTYTPGNSVEKWLDERLPIVRIGAGSDLLPRLAKLPVRVKDRLLSRRFGLAD